MEPACKPVWKRMITVILCAVMITVGFRAATAYAAKSKPPLKVAWNGAAVSLVKVQKDGSEEAASLETVVDKWGEPDKKVKLDDVYTQYFWKNGKSTVQFDTCKNSDTGDAFLCHFFVQLKGKNDALCGIKIGMKKETAIKKLQKMYGKNNVCAAKEGQNVNLKKGKYVPTGKPTGDDEYIYVNAYTYVLPLYIDLKDNKVITMRFSS